jgi:hypothetical protein
LCASVNQASYGTAHLAPTHSARECRPCFRRGVGWDKVLSCPAVQASEGRVVPL